MDNIFNYEMMLEDRIAKIKAIDEQYDLKNKGYIAFSGGKDSCILSKLIDLAIPDNKIPRVFINTGIEFVEMVKFVKGLAQKDDRIIIINNRLNIKQTLETYGYPFKSKPYAKMVGIYRRNGLTDYVKNFIDPNKTTKYNCPKSLVYQFTPENKLKIDYYCCIKFKETPSEDYAKSTGRTINLTGIRKDEGGTRAEKSCVVFDKSKNLKKFHPLLVVSDEWEEEFIKRNNLDICKLYYPPYNFKRTGCKGCPFARDIEKQLLIMKEILPNEYKQCLYLWRPVYEEYKRIGYRISKNFEF